MRKVIGMIVAVLVIVGGLYFCGDWRVQSDDDAKQEAAIAQGIDTVPMLIMQVQKCSKLYTAEYRVHKIVTHDDALRLKGSLLKKQFDIKLPMADRKIAIPIDAKLKAYIDFSDFSEKNIERDGKKITIVLPDPQVSMTSSKIDQKNVRQYVALTRSDFSDAELADYSEDGDPGERAAQCREGARSHVEGTGLRGGGYHHRLPQAVRSEGHVFNS